MGGGRIWALAAVIGLGLTVASCAPFGGYVADHWPHWAGGLPEGAPPRPGQPGYEEFIAHKGLDGEAQRPPEKEERAAVRPTRPNAPPDDTAVSRGGLY